MDEVSRGLDDMALGKPEETSQHPRVISPIQACGCAELVRNEFGALPTPLHRCKGHHHLPIIKEEIQGDQLYLSKLANKPLEDKSPEKLKSSPEDSGHMSDEFMGKNVLDTKDSLEETMPRDAPRVLEVLEPQEPSDQKIDRAAEAQAELENTEAQSLFEQSEPRPVHLTQAKLDAPDTICALAQADALKNCMGATTQVENQDVINAEKLKLDQADIACQDENSPLQVDNTDMTVKEEHISQHISTSDEDSTIPLDDQIQIDLAQGQLERQNQPVPEHSETTEECIAVDLTPRQDGWQEEVHAGAQPAATQSAIPNELYTEDMHPAENESVIPEQAAAQSQSFMAQEDNDQEPVLKKVASQTVLVYTASDELSPAQAVPEADPRQPREAGQDQDPMQASSESNPNVASLQSEDMGQVAESVQVIDNSDDRGAEAEVSIIRVTDELNFMQASDSAGAAEFNASIVCTKEL